MSEHLDLTGLLRGELDNATVIEAGEHLSACAECREELAETAVGHALLARAGRTLGPAVVEPRPSLELRPVPHRRRRGAALLGAAAAVVLAVGVTGTAWWATRDTGGARPTGGIEAALSPLSVTEPGDGSVRMVEHDGRTRMTFSVHDLPTATDGEFYYAWLLDPGTNKMLALGLVDPDAGATFDVDDRLVASYSAVDVSLENDDGDPAHSVTSVLRGSYEPDRITPNERNR